MARIMIKSVLNSYLLQTAKSRPIYCLGRKFECSVVNFEKYDETDLDVELQNFKENYKEFGIGKKYAIQKIQQLFDVSRYVASDIVAQYSKLKMVTAVTIKENFEDCKNNGISDATLLNSPEVLAQRKLPLKIEMVKRMNCDINTVVPLLCLELDSLSAFVEKHILECNSVDGGRIKFLSQLLKVSENKVCKVLVEKKFLGSISLEKLEANVKALSEYNITPADVVNDLWVLLYSTSIIRERLEFAKRNNVEKLKTWMVRAQLEILETYLRRRSDNKSVLGDNSLAEYLSERLDCTIEEAKVFTNKHPALQNKSMKKLKEIIDFLYSEGFQPSHICRVPKILLHSVETTRKRLKELEEQGMKVDSLYILTKSQRQYRQYYEALVKINKTKNVKTEQL